MDIICQLQKGEGTTCIMDREEKGACVLVFANREEKKENKKLLEKEGN